jgi:hypothetical protein
LADPMRTRRVVARWMWITMPDLLEQAINSGVPNAAKLIQDAFGVESEDVVNYCFPKDWPADREQRQHHRRVAANRSAFVSLMTEFGGLVGDADVMSALVPGVKNASWRIDHLIGAREV